MESGEELWDDVVKKTADDLRGVITREVYAPYLERLRDLSTFSEKSIYMFVAFLQPQRYLSIKRGVGFRSKNTLDQSLKRLREGGYLRKDENHFWWARSKEKS